MTDTTLEQDKEFPEIPDDQFKLAGELSGPYGFPDVINSRRYVRLLRIVRKYGPIKEGQLADKCGEKMFMPDWSPMIQRLSSLPFEYIKLTPAGYGKASLISLTEKGEEWCKYKLDPKPTPAESTE
ncbi:MAG: hypothetical protein WB249_15995 [Candidatus Sulfotelmatobacter sp.]